MRVPGSHGACMFAHRAICIVERALRLTGGVVKVISIGRAASLMRCVTIWKGQPSARNGYAEPDRHHNTRRLLVCGTMHAKTCRCSSRSPTVICATKGMFCHKENQYHRNSIRSGSAYVPETRDNSFVGGSGTTFKNLVHCGSLIVSREHNSNGPLAMLEHDILTFL